MRFGLVACFLAGMILISGCGPTLHCNRAPMEIRKFTGDTAFWHTVRYFGPDGKPCADITKRETWDGYMVFVGHRLINEDRNYPLEEAEKTVESRYCQL